MATGKQDYHPWAVIEGRYGNSFIPILVDSNGQLYIIIQGTDGASLHTLAVDSNGNLIARIKGSDAGTLRDVHVDSNGNMIARIQGMYAGTPKDVTLDTDGNMISVIKGDYGGTLKTVAVDADGYLQTNISRQGLEYLKVSPTYGGLRYWGRGVDLPDDVNYQILYTITGRGAILHALISWGSPGVGTEGMGIYVDTYGGILTRVDYLMDMGLGYGENFPFYPKIFDLITPKFTVVLSQVISFDQQFELCFLNHTGSTLHVWYSISYQLVS